MDRLEAEERIQELEERVEQLEDELEQATPMTSVDDPRRHEDITADERPKPKTPRKGATKEPF